MRVIYRKIIPQIILALLLLYYFSSDIIVGVAILSNNIKNACIIPPLQEIQCSTKPVKIEGSKWLKIKIPAKSPTFKFIVNRSPEEINTTTSYFELSASNNALEETIAPEKAFSMFSYAKRIAKIPFKDKRVEIVNKGDSKSEIVLNYDKNFNEGYMATAQINVTDKAGRSGFGWILGSSADSYLDYFIGSYGYLIQYLIWFAAVFGTSFKSSTWSTVYNSESKEPILGAVVRIFQGATLVESFVTGETGVLYTKLLKGKYRLMVTHSKYTFPSKLAPLPTDGDYKNLYYGGDIEIRKDNSNLKINIPLDPTEPHIKTGVFKKVSLAFASTLDTFNPFLIILLVVSQAVIWPTYTETWAFAVIGIGLLAMQQYQKNKQKKTPGMVLDEHGNSISNLKINLYDGQWQRRIDTKVTNAKGEYDFIVPHGDYYLMIEDPNYLIQGADADGKYNVPQKKTTSKAMYINEKLVLTANMNVNPAVNVASDPMLSQQIL